MRTNHQDIRLLRMIARASGIATSYIDYRGRRVTVPVPVLRGMIGAISGTPIPDKADAADLRAIYAAIRQDKVDRILPAAIVAWDGAGVDVGAWLPVGTKAVDITLTPEDGGKAETKTGIALRDAHHRRINGADYLRARVTWDAPVPYGYYRLKLRTDTGRTVETMMISAPSKLPELPHCWGAFAPAYALRTEKTRGIGGFAELHEAARAIKKQGGEFIGTLPLLPLSYDETPPQTSPYSPVSRLFWNEIFLDLAALPGPYQYVPDPALPDGDLVDYEACHAHKTREIMKAAQAFFAAHPGGDDGYKDYAAKTPKLADYAAFRAAKYPPSMQKAVTDYHLFAQYACHVQLSKLKDDIENGRAAALYLDYTVGVHQDGFDARNMPDQFLKKYQVGAPPDMMFNGGQAWGFEPPHPRRLEESGYRYLRDCYHHYFQYSKIMRVDHVMGLHRLYCVPDGHGAKDGTYVYYNLDAQVAVLALEAYRHKATVIGEDLGTVPPRIRDAMERHRIGRMWIAQHEVGGQLKKSFNTIRPDMIAAFNTHDMFPFAAYLAGLDLETGRKMGFLGEKEYERLKKERARKTAALRKAASPYLAVLTGMAGSKARMAMVNMEDMWGETRPQNMPGTTTEYPNWRRRFPKTIEEWANIPLFRDAVTVMNRHRMARP